MEKCLSLADDRLIELIEDCSRVYPVFRCLQDINLKFVISFDDYSVSMFSGDELLGKTDILHRDPGATEVLLMANYVRKSQGWDDNDENIPEEFEQLSKASEAYVFMLTCATLNRKGNILFKLIDVELSKPKREAFKFGIQSYKPSVVQDSVLKGNMEDKEKEIQSLFAEPDNPFNVRTPAEANQFVRNLPYDNFASTSSSSPFSSNRTNDFQNFSRSVSGQNYNANPFPLANSWDNYNYVGMLNEAHQKGNLHYEIYNQDSSGLDHDKTFRTQLFITPRGKSRGYYIGYGKDKSSSFREAAKEFFHTDSGRLSSSR